MIPIRDDFILNWDRNAVSFRGREIRFPSAEFEIFAVLRDELQFIPLEMLKVKVLGRLLALKIENSHFLCEIKRLKSRLQIESLPVEILSPGKEKFLLRIKET